MNWHWLERHRAVGPLVALVVLYGVFAAAQPETFATLGNLRTMVRQTSVVGMGALGMTLVIVLGGIDLSVGSIVAFVTVVIAWLLQAGWAPLPAAAAGILVGGCCGLANGVLITGLRVTPFIVTLGAMGIIRGAAKGLAHEQKIDAPMTWLNDLVAELPRSQSWMLLPPGVWLTHRCWRRPRSCSSVHPLRPAHRGRRVERSGRAALRRAGAAREDRVYALEGLLAGAAGLMQFSRLTVGDPTVAAGLELDVIAAVVIGGGSLAGGEGSILGALVGALLMTEIKTGCTHAGLSPWVQEIITGGIIVVAVALDRFRHRGGEAVGR